ncbi:MAG TPA: glycosyltransferase [Gallicola sp.]|nr:glycosyltransferase [Gallicola sp.]
MKVLQINAVNYYGSTGRTTFEMNNELKKRGHQSYVAYSVGQRDYGDYLIGSKLDTLIHGLASRILGKQGYFSFRATKRLINYMSKIKPDIVHLRNLHANYINTNMLFKYLAKREIATVITLHDCWFYTGKCTHYTLDNCYKWIEGCNNCPRLLKDNKSWFFDKTKVMWLDKRRYLNNIPRVAIIGVSDWITKQAQMSFLSQKKIERIYNWIDIEVFKPMESNDLRQKLGIKEHYIILGVASSWSRSKNIDNWIELSKNLSDREVIVLVGRLEKGIELPRNIIHINRTESINELAEIYSMSDVFINMVFENSFGKVSAEALSCGTPVITINSTANPELVTKGCGVIVEDIKIMTLINAIKEVKKNGKQYYKETCRSFAIENFNIHKRVTDYINIYDYLLKGKS